MPPVDEEIFIILAELATTNVVMLTHDGPYCQIDRLTMVSPLDSTINFLNFFPLFEKYMDDILRSIKQQFIETKLKGIYALHSNFKFTVEVEAEVKIPFLDLFINHVKDKLSPSWYCKPGLAKWRVMVIGEVRFMTSYLES